MIDFFSADEYVKPECGDILISEPYLPDPNFERSVILLCEHNEEGSFGFILNHLAQTSLDEIVEEVDTDDLKVFVGGPVQKDTLHFLHQKPDAFKNDQKINEGIYWGGDFDGLLSAINTRTIDVNSVKFFVGYSGWSSGQLDEELNAKSWIVCKNVTADLIFNLEPKDLWKEVLARMGGKFKMIANYPTDPRLN
ncbi:MAG: putative transcriptional regulator [Cyclobacteriaceae bacterium]|jgi:putative transcriptional regulator